jgi:hypothetical protein
MSPSDNGRNQRAQIRLTVVGGQVFTRDIEHTFENRVILVMREVLV